MRAVVRLLIVALSIALVMPAGLVGDFDALAKKKGKGKTRMFSNAEFVTISPGAANGVWRLFVYDDTDDNGGSLGDGWSLTITAKVKDKKKRQYYRCER